MKNELREILKEQEVFEASFTNPDKWRKRLEKAICKWAVGKVPKEWKWGGDKNDGMDAERNSFRRGYNDCREQTIKNLEDK